jgi:hypothetical protein
VRIDLFGAPFNLMSIDVERFEIPSSFAGIPIDWSMTSSKGGMQLLSTVGTALFLGPDWQGVTSVVLSGNGTGQTAILFHFDNITINNMPLGESVPEPSTIGIWSILGCVGIGIGNRRRQSKSSTG